MARIQCWTKLNAEQLWHAWRSHFAGDDAAAAHAVWCANRLVKGRPRSTRRLFYAIKDDFIRHIRGIGMGYRVRLETKTCWACEGTGEWCDRCDGTGIWSERWLYLHCFEVAGQRYAFHSYVEPVNLDHSRQGEDRESYGSRFDDAEEAELPLPFSGILRMLRYLVAVGWPALTVPAKKPLAFCPKGS